mgnify:FL=1
MNDFITNYNRDGDRRSNPNPQDTHGSGGYANDETEVYDDLPPRHKPHMHVEKDRRFWEAGMRLEIPEFHGSLQPEEFLDWLAVVEEILEFKGVPEDKRMQLVATQFRNRATAWWQQTKLMRSRAGKAKISSWEKMN